MPAQPGILHLVTRCFEAQIIKGSGVLRQCTYLESGTALLTTLTVGIDYALYRVLYFHICTNRWRVEWKWFGWRLCD